MLAMQELRCFQLPGPVCRSADLLWASAHLLVTTTNCSHVKTPTRTTTMQMSSWGKFWQFVQDYFGCANRLLQQLLSGFRDRGGERAGCGGPQLMWGCEAGWMYCQILSNAFRDGLWSRNEHLTNRKSKKKRCLFIYLFFYVALIFSCAVVIRPSWSSQALHRRVWHEVTVSQSLKAVCDWGRDQWRDITDHRLSSRLFIQICPFKRLMIFVNNPYSTGFNDLYVKHVFSLNTKWVWEHVISCAPCRCVTHLLPAPGTSQHHFRANNFKPEKQPGAGAKEARHHGNAHLQNKWAQNEIFFQNRVDLI